MKNFMKEFKEFAFKGSLLDLAIGVIIGGAVGKLVAAFVADIIMPLVGMIFGSTDFSAIVLGPVKIGSFLTVLIDFILLAFILFVMIRAINRFKKKEDVQAEASETELLTEILEQLKKR